MEAEVETKISTISDRTWVNLGSVGAVIGAVVLIVFYAAALKADGVTNSLRQDRSEQRIDGLEGKMDVVNDRTARMEEMMKFLVLREKQK